MKEIKAIIIGIVILGFSLCSVAQVKPSIDRSFHFEISENSAHFGAKGGSKTFAVNASDSWRISKNSASWWTLEKKEKEVVIIVYENLSVSSRSGSFELLSGSKTIRVDISQKAADLYLSLSSQELSFEADGGSQTINVTTNGSWSVETDTDYWGHLSRNGNSITVEIDPNKSNSLRTDWFSIKSATIEKRVNITQKAHDITLSLSQYELDFDASGSTKTITITTNGNWSISTNMVSWGHLTKDGNSLTVRVDQNTSTSSRTDWFEITAGNVTKRVNVIQREAAVTLSLSSQELSFESNGGTRTITVSTNGSWRIGMNTASWGHLTQNGNSLTVRIDANPNSESRTDWFTIKVGNLEQRVNITQKAEIKPTARITSVTQSHNQPYNMYTNCMKITVKFETEKMKNKRLYCYAYFYGADNITPLHTQWGNQVSVSNSETAPYDNTTFTMTLVMAYTDLNMVPGFSGYLTFDIVIKDSSGNVLDRENNNSFTFSRGWY